MDEGREGEKERERRIEQGKKSKRIGEQRPDPTDR